MPRTRPAVWNIPGAPGDQYETRDVNCARRVPRSINHVVACVLLSPVQQPWVRHHIIVPVLYDTSNKPELPPQKMTRT